MKKEDFCNRPIWTPIIKPLRLLLRLHRPSLLWTLTRTSLKTQIASWWMWRREATVLQRARKKSSGISKISCTFCSAMKSDWAGQLIWFITDSSTYLSSPCNFPFSIPAYLLQPQIPIWSSVSGSQTGVPQAAGAAFNFSQAYYSQLAGQQIMDTRPVFI